MSRNVWGFWDCHYCDNTHIRGDNTECPCCSHARDASVKFYMDTNNIVEVSTDRKNDRPNWICSFCGNQNDDEDNQCTSCGASKDDKSGDYFHRDDEVNVTDSLSESTLSAYESSEPTKLMSSYRDYKSNLRSHIARIPYRKILKIAIPLLVAFTVIFGIVLFIKWFNTPIEKKLTISSVSWTRSIDIEELRTYDESSWSLPSGARLSYTRQEIRSYSNVIDHYETKTRQVSEQQLVGYRTEVVGYQDLGNGQFREITKQVPEYKTVYRTETYQDPVYRKEPIYDTKYYYEIDRWTRSRSVDTSGYDKNPYWGEVTLCNKERQSTSHENYYISGIVEEESQRFELTLSDWNGYNVGDNVRLVVKQGNNAVISIERLN